MGREEGTMRGHDVGGGGGPVMGRRDRMGRRGTVMGTE